jgi:hypothetical protein
VINFTQKFGFQEFVTQKLQSYDGVCDVVETGERLKPSKRAGSKDNRSTEQIEEPFSNPGNFTVIRKDLII